jgi:transposase
VDILSRLFQLPPQMRLAAWNLDEATVRLTLTVVSEVPAVRCPICLALTSRIHSRYERTPIDLPCGLYSVLWKLHVRKFFCTNPACKRQIFTERLEMVKCSARCTLRLAESLASVGLALGGMPGARLIKRLGMQFSHDTLLRAVHRMALPDLATPSVLGIDDWAKKKGRTYGTVIVDLETHRPVALLADREAGTVAKWLQDHPGVKIVTRDRSRAYAKGIAQGAPDALQVADRFHLLRNLAETLEQVFSTHSVDLKSVERAIYLESCLSEDGTIIVPVPPPSSTVQEKQKAEQRRGRQLYKHQQVWQLRHQGLSGKAIAKQLGIGKTTVFCLLRSEQFAERRGRSDRGYSQLAPFKAHLLKQWNAGIHEGKLLFREVQKHGYRGSYTTVARYLRRLRQSHNEHRSKGEEKPLAAQSERMALTPRRAAFLVLQRPQSSNKNDLKFVERLVAQNTELAEAIVLSQDFAELVRNLQPEKLAPWLERAAGSASCPFRRFAKSLGEDQGAVKAGVTVYWSNGQVEGQINRLKMLKRQMYGRAGINLLSRRFLLAV